MEIIVGMDRILYQYSLSVAMTLMLFFGFYFLTARKPGRPGFDIYIRSRRIMGVALLVLSVNYMVHLLSSPRFNAPLTAIMMNLSTYYISSWLFSAALTSLLDRNYITVRRFVLHILGWLVYTSAAAAVMSFTSSGTVNTICVAAMTVWFLIYALWLATRLIRTYRRAVKLFDDTQSDHIAAYIKWLSIFTWWAVIYGVSCGLLTFIPDRYVFIWVLSSIPFYIYLYCSYMNYMLFYERVEVALQMPEPLEEAAVVPRQDPPVYYADIEKRLSDWMNGNGFTRPGLTIEDLAEELCTNRTYLSAYIKSTYHITFREWITSLRLEFAKRMIAEHPEMTIGVISETAGFLSQSYFSKTFADKEGVSPARWRQNL